MKKAMNVWDVLEVSRRDGKIGSLLKETAATDRDRARC